MAYNQIFYKTDSAVARSLTSCAAGTVGVAGYTASAESIISQRDTDRKALVWAQAAAQSLVTCRYDPFATVSGLSVLPLTSLAASGNVGGPFSPATVQYTILNFGNEDCNWQCNASEAWVTVSATSGFLYAGESVIIQIGLDANALPVGLHTATLTFYNASKAIVATTRQVTVDIQDAGGSMVTCVEATAEVGTSIFHTCNFVAPEAGTVVVDYTVLFDDVCCFSVTCPEATTGDYNSPSAETGHTGQFTIVVAAAGPVSYTITASVFPCMGEGAPANVSLSTAGLFTYP